MQTMKDCYFEDGYDDAEYIESGAVYDSVNIETNVVHFVSAYMKLIVDSEEFDIRYESGSNSGAVIDNKLRFSDYQCERVDTLLQCSDVLDFVCANRPGHTSLEIARYCTDEEHTHNIKDYKVIEEKGECGLYEKIELKKKDEMTKDKAWLESIKKEKERMGL
jgi:hypothetical protein